LQPSQIILVQSQTVKDELSEHAMLGIGNQYRTQQASAVAIFLSDLEPSKRIDKVYQLEKGYRHPNYRATLPLSASFLIGEGHAATFIKGIATQVLSAVQPMPDVEPVQAWSYKNTALLAQTFVYAAESHDLATTMMEGFDPRRVKDILRIPDRYGVPLMVATGYEYEDDTDSEPTRRLDVSEVVFEDTFGKGWIPSKAEKDALK
jgi:nitroreductase